MTPEALAILEGLFKAFIFVPCMALIAWWLFANLMDKILTFAEAAIGALLLFAAFILGVISMAAGGWGFLGILAVIYTLLLVLACWEYIFWRKREIQHWLDEIDRYVNAADRDPNNAAAYSFLGQAHMKLGNFDDAVAAFEKALELEPESKQDKSLLKRAGEYQSRPPWYLTFRR